MPLPSMKLPRKGECIVVVFPTHGFSKKTKTYNVHSTFTGLHTRVSAAYLRQWTYGSCRMGLYSYFLDKVCWTLLLLC
jgi:hypothetical protein